MCPQELQGFLTSITQTYKFNYLPGPLAPMGKPCVFLSEHQGHRRQCRMPHAAWIHRAPRFCLNFPTNLSRSREGRGPGKFGGPPPLFGVVSTAQTHLQQCWGPSGLWGGSESVCGAFGAWLGTCLALWGLLQAKCWDLSELELVKAAAAGGISGLTAPGLCCRSDYLRWGEVGRAGAAPRSS